MPQSPLLVEEATTLEQARALAPEWEALAVELEPRLPFNHPFWHLRWFESFAQQRSTLRDRLSLRALRRTDGELVGVAPMMLTERPSVGPVRVRTLQFLGADPNITELRGVLCRPSDERDVYRTLLGELRRERDSWDLVQWSGMRQGGEGCALVLDEPGAEPGHETPDYLLDLPATWEQFQAGLSRNIKESLRKCRNGPKRDGLVFEPRVITEGAALDGALTHFFALHGARAAASGTIAHNDAFVADHAQRFLRAVARDAQGSGRFRAYQLLHGEKVIASRLAFVLGDSMYLYYSGYDLDYSRYSVMTSCVAFALRHAIESGLKTVNLSTGNDISKTRWGPREQVYRDALWVSPSVRGRLARGAYSVFTAAREHGPLRDSVLGRFLSLGARHRPERG